MAQWLKSYAIYIHFPPNLTHVTTLPCYQHSIYYNQTAQIWCQSAGAYCHDNLLAQRPLQHMRTAQVVPG